MLYAAYGSNLHPRRLQARTPSARLLGTAQLAGWSLHFHKRSFDRSAKCNILQTGGGVHVAVYALSEPDRVVLNEIEGLGKGYDERLIVLPGYGECFTYVAAETHIDEALEVYDWYKELVMIGATLHEFPADYVLAIEKISVVSDPDSKRTLDRWRTVEMVRASE